MTQRSRIDIIGDILKSANKINGTNRSMIMYKAFLSYTQLKNYLKTLTEMDLLNYDKDTRTFKTTEKGLRFLNAYYRIDDAIKIIPSRVSQTRR
ncbi:MAG TPA: winged helix-turn-helix domain-containing protein [Nitrososphaera sp.]|nr:winged helix-turn-helix domain-containing protein [Nitrososphaera sp.]